MPFRLASIRPEGFRSINEPLIVLGNVVFVVVIFAVVAVVDVDSSL